MRTRIWLSWFVPRSQHHQAPTQLAGCWPGRKWGEDRATQWLSVKGYRERAATPSSGAGSAEIWGWGGHSHEAPPAACAGRSALPSCRCRRALLLGTERTQSGRGHLFFPIPVGSGSQPGTVSGAYASKYRAIHPGPWNNTTRLQSHRSAKPTYKHHRRAWGRDSDKLSSPLPGFPNCQGLSLREEDSVLALPKGTDFECLPLGVRSHQELTALVSRFFFSELTPGFCFCFFPLHFFG